MSILKCKMCGGTVEFENGATVGVCDSCGTKQTLPRLDDDRKANLYDRANHFRRNNEYDKAMSIYEQILNEDNTDAESYWSLVLCKYGIEYVEDPTTHNRVPTVNRAQFTSVIADEDYKKALEYADIEQKIIYEEEAKAIDEIQKGILEISQKEEPFDVFICYKETDNSGRRTQDSVLANDLYHQLAQEGFKVFFSRITLEDKLGTAYEPYIFAALNSAKVMVVLGTKPEYFNAVWVKNEWSRYLALIKKGEKKILIPAYKDMDPYDLPEEFSHLQAQDMTKLGFMQDLIRGIKKIAGPEPAPTVQTQVVNVGGYSANVAALLKRGQITLEDGDWNKADGIYEEVLNQDPECAEAYLGKFLVENKAVSLSDYLSKIEEKTSSADYETLQAREPDEDHINGIVKAYTVQGYLEKEEIRKKYYFNFGYSSELSSRERQKEEVLGSIDNDRLFARLNQYATDNLKYEVDSFVSDIKSLLESRIDSARVKDDESITRINDEYSAFLDTSDIKVKDEYKKACEKKESDYIKLVSDGRNATDSISCSRVINDIKERFFDCNYSDEIVKELSNRTKELERAEKRRKNRKRNAVIAVVSILTISVVLILTFAVFIPNIKYNAAVQLMNAGQYDDAKIAFQNLNGFKDSKSRIESCDSLIIKSKYDNAIALFNKGQYDDAISSFTELNGYESSQEYILRSKYQLALNYKDNEEYDDAIALFSEIDGYMDSSDQIAECNTLIELKASYDEAMGLYDAGQYEEALNAFRDIEEYGDSSTQIANCEENLYNEAVSLMESEQYDEAIEVLEEIGDYDGASEMKRECGFEELINEEHSVGDVVTFGDYNDANKWIVLDISGTQILLLNTTKVGYVTFDEESNDWDSSSLKNWLNTTYYNNAFNDQERSLIVDKGYGNAFVLSINEYEMYSSYIYTEAGYAWWLRSPGGNRTNAAQVRLDGTVGEYGYIQRGDIGVRPALWIDLEP